jgi:hypothetical protein
MPPRMRVASRRRVNRFILGPVIPGRVGGHLKFNPKWTRFAFLAAALGIVSLCSLTGVQLAAQVAGVPDPPAAGSLQAPWLTTPVSASSACICSASFAELAAVPSAPAANDPSLPEGPNPQQAPSAAASPATTPQTAQQPNPKAPASSAAPPSLEDLGLSPSQTQGNAQQQALLDKRTHMLKIHQKLGLITTVPLLATLVSSGGAKARFNRSTGTTTIVEPSSAYIDLHAALGSATVGMYFATAYFAIRAPKVAGTKPRGAIRLHRDLAWIHGPGMILTPILGEMAFSQESKGEKVHGIASAHSYVAWTTALAYGAAIVSVSWPIKLKF